MYGCCLLLLLGVILLLDGVSPMKLSQNDVDESLNLVEPSSNNWFTSTNKSKGKSTLKNVIRALQVYESRKKLLAAKNKEKPNSTTSTTTVLPSTSTSEASTRPNSAFAEYSMMPSLHSHEQEKRRYHHSFIEGWTFK